MLLTEVIKPRLYVSYFQQEFGAAPNHVANIGIFTDVRSAERACKQYFRNTVIKNMRNEIIQSYERGDLSNEALDDALEVIDMDASDTDQWSFQEYIHNGQTMLDMGSGEYVFAGTMGRYPTEQDLFATAPK